MKDGRGHIPMQATAKLFFVVLVLGIGVACALFFRRPAPTPTEAAPAAPPETLVLRGQPTHIGPPESPGTWKADIRRPMVSDASRLPVPIAVPSSPQLRRDPPHLPSRYDRTLPSVTRPIVDPVPEIPTQELPKLTIIDPRGPELPRTHKIQDGDTLASLAEKYLGDASRHEEIHAANSALLSNPDLLPIGVVLKIPASGSVAENPVAENPVTSEATSPRATQPTARPQGLPVADPLPESNPLPRKPSDPGPLVPIPRGMLRS